MITLPWYIILIGVIGFMRMAYGWGKDDGHGK
jgi:hypothetical protein